MSENTQLQLARLLERTDNIRNIFVFAPPGHAKSYITDALVSAAGVIAPHITPAITNLTGPSASEDGPSTHNAVDKQCSTKDGFDTGAGAVSDALVSAAYAAGTELAIYYEMNNHTLPCNGETQSNRFLLNLIDSPQISGSSTEFSADISIADGVLLVVDCKDGVTQNMKTILHQALLESIIPVLSLDLMDESFLLDSEEDDDVGGEQLYASLLSIIKEANAVVKSCENKLLPDVEFYPEKGNIAFSCFSRRWAFTLDDFAKFWAPKLGVRRSDMLEKLWGEHFYDTNRHKWTRQHTGANKCHRGFVLFCYEVIVRIKKYCLKGDTEMLQIVLGDDVSTILAEGFVGNELLEQVMQAWLPAGTVLDMIVMKVPSPSRAQKYRVENLYQGPLNDLYATAIRTCDRDGPQMMYIYKVVPAHENGKSVAFGRIYSGILRSDQNVHLMGPIVSGQNKMDVVKSFNNCVIWIGNEQEHVDMVPCGNMVAIDGLELATANCTLGSQKMLGVFPIRAVSLDIANNKEIEDVILQPIVGSKERDFSLPYDVYNSLYLHQREGLLWLWTLHCKKHGGAILADDMGLGKSRQVSSFVRGLLHSHIIKRAMVIAPSSVVDQWEQELLKVGLGSRKFTKGTDDTHLIELKTTAAEGGVILTTYETARIHENVISTNLGSIDYMFADEGHRIKNFNTSTSQALARINCKYKIVVTGTPVQNNLWEFYSLFSFCCPALLGSYNDFEANFIKPIDRGKHKDTNFRLIAKSMQASKDLKELVAPFILRRTKDLLKAAGRLTSNKFELTVWLKTNPVQQTLYETLVGDDMWRKRGYALEVTKMAKRICMHPSLIMTSGDGESSSVQKISHQLKNSLMNHMKSIDLDPESSNLPSSRLDFLLYFVPKLLEDGHKILMFSMSPGMLKLIQGALQHTFNEEKVIYMDGTTSRSDRFKLIEDFQSENGPSLFLMTTKVGGFGITLTAATRVFIIDPSDNPMDDSQAVDRAYRIGQKRDVVVYRLITCGTIEEYSYRRQVLKTETARNLLEEEQCQREIRKQAGLVLRNPSEGFGVSVTHNELVQIHGNVLDRSLNREKKLIKKHESVFDVFNHSATCSLQEDMPYHMPEVPFLQGRGHHKITTVAHYSRALISTSSATSEIVLKGSGEDIREAERLIQKIIQETIVEDICLKRDAQLVRETIEIIQDKSGAQIKVRDTTDDSSEQLVEMIGTAEEVELAKKMVVRIASRTR